MQDGKKLLFPRTHATNATLKKIVTEKPYLSYLKTVKIQRPVIIGVIFDKLALLAHGIIFLNKCFNFSTLKTLWNESNLVKKVLK